MAPVDGKALPPAEELNSIMSDPEVRDFSKNILREALNYDLIDAIHDVQLALIVLDRLFDEKMNNAINEEP